nr:MAG TPA: hypothetical protein [Caudoviricetes sp.]
MYNLCDKADFGVFTESRAFSLMSHKLYICHTNCTYLELLLSHKLYIFRSAF